MASSDIFSANPTPEILLSDTRLAAPTAPLTVTELSHSIKRTVEGSFARVTVKGEISGYRPASSGHLYFDLKDAESVIAVCCWRPQAARLGFKPEEGLEVIAHGRVTTYPKSSKYQLILDTMEPAGIGQLLAKIEQLRVKLLGRDCSTQRANPLCPSCRRRSASLPRNRARCCKTSATEFAKGCRDP